MNQWRKRDPIKDYFPLPNEVFYLGLVPGELAVYAYLLYCEDRQTYQCWPSYKTIGKAVGMCVNTVQKYGGRPLCTAAVGCGRGSDGQSAF